MSHLELDSQKLIDAALATECSPLAIEEGTGLAEAWIEHGVGRDWNIVAVECGFVMWLDEKTVIVGVQDLLTRDENGVLGNEWKTTKEASKWWNEDKWLESITEGSQIAIYALALRHGTYYPADGSEPLRFGSTVSGLGPRIRVKAISKSTPPCIWPRREEDGIITFSEARLEATKQALLSEAESIRARRRKVGLEGTWRVPGIWCENKFRRVCEFHEDCVAQRPARPTMAFDPNDPAAKLAVPHIDKIDNDLVILSASSYAKSSECAEAYRRSLAREEKESSIALDTGTVFHAICAEYFRQLKEGQNA